MTTLNLNNINDDLIELSRDTFSNKQMGFNIPNKQNRVSQNNFMNDNTLFNRNKISDDVISMSSRSSSRSSSRASSVNGDYDKSAYMKNMKNIYKNKSVSKKLKHNEESENSSIASSIHNKKSNNVSNFSNKNHSYSKNNKNDDDDEDEDDDDEEDGEDGEDDEDDEEERINATIPKFPVEVICMEYCKNTFDDLILNNELTKEEWYSALMQIIMILITYQESFNFTHNDLHTNNVMYNETDKKFIYYCYKKKYYKVPTFGRLFKIIDFGRSIYKFKGKLFCSDSFQTGGDSATQYNTEPYLNEKKPRLEPNYSFDLCRLACSIFDYLIEDISEVKNLDLCDDPIKRLIVEWCLDDKGINILYKNDGTDRYPEFKLYKMIARCVHNHTPQAQLERPEFAAYRNFKGDIPEDVINIDAIPSYV